MVNNAADPAKAPVFTVVSAGIGGDSVFTGQISSTGSNTVEFELSTDESEVDVYPFVSGVFQQNVKSPILTFAAYQVSVSAQSLLHMQGLVFPLHRK